ncbi:MAG: beta-N-acetylhexosaminidase, partial [Microbacteriaceae bacterium]|nr:beta-N-acetylhexosaminidase [Microbacteriaceae bacterium]
MTVSLPLGPLMPDLAGPRLTDEEREVLQHPLVGGVILFKRNFESIAVLQELTFEIHALRQPPLLIAIDHEGGRVQRFRHGFTVLPPMRALGVLWETDPARALEMATAAGYVLAAELRACGIDLSFTPVLDLDHGTSEIIGNRAFHSDPAAVTALAGALIAGLRRAGMANVGKHFPGHGFVAADSHVAIPVDTRPVQALYADLAPYRAHREMDLAAVMPAHVIYEKLDPGPAGFSSYWLRYVLRGELGFDGVIFSDDLSMEGASVAGGFVERADAALAAGCDMVLVCNNPDAARRLLREWRPE